MTITDNMWSMEKRIATRLRLETEAKRAAKRLGAASVVVIASFMEGKLIHTQDACYRPIMPGADFYKELALMYEKLDNNGGADMAHELIMPPSWPGGN